MKRLLYIIILLGVIFISAVSSLKWRQISDATPTVTEINFVDGVTSAIQTQLNAKVNISDLVDPTSLIDSLSAITTILDKTDNYTLQFSGVFGSSTNDLGKTITLTASTAKAVTVPTNAVAPFPIGSTITIIQGGSGEVSIVGSGVTFKSESSWVKIGAQESAIQLIKIATDTWRIIGRLKA